jgi:hypothetical protein
MAEAFFSSLWRIREPDGCSGIPRGDDGEVGRIAPSRSFDVMMPTRYTGLRKHVGNVAAEVGVPDNAVDGSDARSEGLVVAFVSKRMSHECCVAIIATDSSETDF